jgi:CHAT domain-containing protein
MAIVPSGQSLFELKKRPKAAAGTGLFLAVGDVAFGESPARFAAGSEMEIRVATRSPIRGDARYSWPPLPGTAREIEQIASLAPPREVVVLRGTEASTTRVERLLPKAAYAHFATHGFFSDPRYHSAMESSDSDSVDPRAFGRFGDRVSAAARNPLLLSGLVLAGVHALPGMSDPAVAHDDFGILCAETISYLPLEGLQLAVLSACDTGRGDVAGGEGVLGLQRAFHIAGTRNVIASLWQVDDEVTSSLMHRFFLELWRKKKNPMEALREAQLAIYRAEEPAPTQNQDRGIDASKTTRLPGKEASRPREVPLHLWASFVLSGPGD